MNACGRSLEDLIDEATKAFRKQFNSHPVCGGYAPGRVNLIGEHVDYNDGFVLPMALPLGTLIIGQKTNTGFCQILTLCEEADDPKFIAFKIPSIGNPLSRGKPSWANYIKGVISNFTGTIYSFDAVIISTVPTGGGLSSSAALEVATYMFLEALSNEPSDENLQKKALACQKAEHEFALMPCGIMDQFIAFMGKENHSLLIDCRSLESTLVPFIDPDVQVLITNSNVHHVLTGSEYPERRKCCEDAVKIIGKTSLRDATMQDLENYKDKMTNEMYKRVKHVITETNRTVSAADALNRGDYNLFGKLMIESHKSLKDDFEVSCEEIDELVNLALEVEGVYGSRMTGGGFGGCTVTLVKSNALKSLIENIKKKYKGNPLFYVCTPSNGACQLLLNNV
ncbi:galactokinase-like [Centruroides vittatus]|uniref:galactokinase-like n=1 Tax=Centruroides vittatus TaxID=120091 RepID=UPI00350F8678